jgi:hypothetical protein
VESRVQLLRWHLFLRCFVHSNEAHCTPGAGAAAGHARPSDAHGRSNNLAVAGETKAGVGRL